MTNFKLFETSQFLKNLEGEFGGQQKRIKRKLRSYVYPQLKQQPHFGKNIKKLRDYKPETWRYRIGDYRFFYEVDDHKKIVFMISADNRANAY
ncbi:MAG: type II toxin-antitoxin system RelE/ParE family toxin [Candidatus Omnitrophica bacterium]|nr:type II toxin-antitoxin system RelE/ParE family toxin [Candidatus Omnitrophota bacterium]